MTTQSSKLGSSWSLHLITCRGSCYRQLGVTCRSGSAVIGAWAE